MRLKRFFSVTHRGKKAEGKQKRLGDSAYRASAAPIRRRGKTLASPNSIFWPKGGIQRERAASQVRASPRAGEQGGYSTNSGEGTLRPAEHRTPLASP